MTRSALRGDIAKTVATNSFPGSSAWTFLAKISNRNSAKDSSSSVHPAACFRAPTAGLSLGIGTRGGALEDRGEVDGFGHGAIIGAGRPEERPVMFATRRPGRD